MKLEFFAFSILHAFFLLPAISLSSLKCDDPQCQAVHGYAIHLIWGEWGIGAEILF